MFIGKTKSRITIRKTTNGITVYLRYRGEDAWESLNDTYEKYKGQNINLKITYDKINESI
jgi:hypothetical protein